MVTRAHIFDKRSIVGLLLLALVLVAMHILGSVQSGQSNLGAVGHIALEDDPWSGVNFSDFDSGQTTYVPGSYTADQYDTYSPNVYGYGASSSGASDFSVSQSYYGGYAPSSGVSDYNDSSWNSTPTYGYQGDFGSTGSVADYYASDQWQDSSEPYDRYSASGSYYGSTEAIDYPAFSDGTFDQMNDSYWPEGGISTGSYWGGGDYWYGTSDNGNNTFSTSESYYNYQDNLTSGFDGLRGFSSGESTGVSGVYVDNSFNYSGMYTDPSGMGYYNVPGTEYYGSGWGTPTDTNYAVNPLDYYYGSENTYEYLDRCLGMGADGNDTLYCGRGPSPTELYATYGADYIGYTKYAADTGRCSLKDGDCAVETPTTSNVRRTQSGAIIDASVPSFKDRGYSYGYDVVYDIPRAGYSSTPTTYRTVQQTAAPQVQYMQVPTPISVPVSATPVLSAPMQLSCDLRIVHNDNFISVYYLTSNHTVRAYISNIGAVDPAVGTAKARNVYPPFAGAYIMTVYGAQGQTANCTAVTPEYSQAPVQQHSQGEQSYTYPMPQVQVHSMQSTRPDYVRVGALPYTGLEGTVYFFIVLFSAAASIGVLFVYQEVFVSDASSALASMLGMKRFHTLGTKIENATKHHNLLDDIPRDK